MARKKTLASQKRANVRRMSSPRSPAWLAHEKHRDLLNRESKTSLASRTPETATVVDCRNLLGRWSGQPVQAL